MPCQILGQIQLNPFLELKVLTVISPMSTFKSQTSQLRDLQKRERAVTKQIQILTHQIGVLETGDEHEYVTKLLKQHRTQILILTSRVKQLTTQNEELKQSIDTNKHEIDTMLNQHKEIFSESKSNSENNNNNNGMQIVLF